MIIAIRIAGQVGLNEDVNETLFRIRLRRKYSAVLIKPSKENLKILRNVRNQIAYGDIDSTTLKKLIEKRGIPIKRNAKINPETIIAQLEKDSKKLDIKPFFRLHPPRGGIESKKHAGVGKGVLGDNKKKINDLVKRML
jgi:large subunit ribosomal protein L30